nr:TPA_asm: RNA-dependent polymerase [Pelias marna-like virus]|mmetsp:Transcript_143557/g.202990  ORF Transcript_143557/g.202990 Transcript_143557/m.202990 type:complete len:1642 (+) Transcript_143557:606-5531(+)
MEKPSSTTNVEYDAFYKQVMYDTSQIMKMSFVYKILGAPSRSEELFHMHIHLYHNLRTCDSPFNLMYIFMTYMKNLTNMKYGTVLRLFEKHFILCFSLYFGKQFGQRLFATTAQSKSTTEVKDFLTSIRELVANYDKAIDSEFGRKFSYLCATILCMPLCLKLGIDSTTFGFSEVFDKRLKKQVNRDNHISFAMETIDNISYLIDKLVLYYETRDFNSLFFEDTEETLYNTNFELLSHYSDKFSLLANKNMSVRDYLNLCDQTIEIGKKLRALYHSDKYKSGILRTQQASLARFKLRAMDKDRVNSTRPLPLTYCVFSAPGCGKSNFIEKLNRTIYEYLQHMGIEHKPYDPSMLYVFNEDDDYMSEFKISHEVILLDDVDQFIDDITKQKNGGALAKSIIFNNTVPYVTNQASLEDKGMIPFMCKIVAYTSNSHDMGISKVFKKHGGAYRRVPFIDLVVKPEYRKAGQTQLAGDLSEDGFKNHNLYDIWFRKFIQKGASPIEVYWNPDTESWITGDKSTIRPMEFGEFCKFYYQNVMIPHYSQADLANKSLDHFKDMKLCPQCLEPNVTCGCKTEAQSRAYQVYSEVSETVEYLATFIAPFLMAYIYILLFLHLLCGKIVGRNSPNYFSRKLASNIKKLPSRYNLPWFIYWMPEGILAYLVCEGWYTTVRDVAVSYKMTHNQFLRNVSRTDILNKYKLGYLATFTIFSTGLYAYYKSIVEAQSKPVPDQVQAKENVWKSSFVPVTRMTGAPSTCTTRELIKACEHNTVCIKVYKDDQLRFASCGFGLKGTTIVIPKHFYEQFCNMLPCRIDILRTSIEDQLSSNRFKLLVTRENFLQCTSKLENDLIFFQHNSLTPFRNLSKFLLNDFMRGKAKGFIVTRQEDGKAHLHEFHGLSRGKVHYYTPNRDYVKLFQDQAYAAWSKTPTFKGQCGSPYVVSTPNGNFIAGIHIAGGAAIYGDVYKVECHKIFGTDVDTTRFQPVSFNGLDFNSTFQTEKDLTIEPKIHPKDPVRQISGVANVFGTMPNYNRRKMKSAVDRPLCAEQAKKHFNMPEFTHHSPRDIKSSIATVKNIEPMCEKPTFAQNKVNEVEDHLYNNWLNTILSIQERTGKEFPGEPFDIDVGINGYDGATYIDRLPVKTSTGFPYGGAKLKHLVELEPIEGHAVRYGLDKQCQDAYNTILQAYVNEELADVVFDSCFKDEPHSTEKIEANKCRIFNSGPLAYMVLCRQYFLPFIPYFSGNFRHEFGMAIGANATGPDWKTLYEYITKFGKDRIIAGDYSKFDKRMTAQIMTAVMNVLIRICKYFGWEDIHLRIMRGIASQACYPITNVFGLVMQFDGSNPSGWPLTTVLNGGCNIMYMMLALKDIEEDQNESRIDFDDFFNYFSLLTYGDDNIGGAHPDIDYINHTAISNALAKYGVIYTMADKHSESVPHIHISQADFLKRKFVPNVNGEGTIAAPLDMASIKKMLTCILVSKEISIEEQTAAVIDSANRELFQHGKETFEEHHAFLLNILRELNLWGYIPHGTLPGYDYFKTRQDSLYAPSEAQSRNIMQEIYNEVLQKGREYNVPMREFDPTALIYINSIPWQFRVRLAFVHTELLYPEDFDDLSSTDTESTWEYWSDSDDDKENNSLMANRAIRRRWTV